MKNIFYVISLLVVFYSCKTDFEINAPYDKVPIVYGILDQSVDTQFIKINKSFLGTDNLSYTSINDSMYFKTVTARIEELDDNEQVLRVFLLQEKFVNVAASSGIFFTGQQKVFYFVPATPLDETKEYRIVGEGDGKPFSATTNLVDGVDFALRFKNYTNVPQGIGLYNSGVFNDIEPEWSQSPEAYLYDITVRFHYTEYRNGNVTNEFIDWFVGSRNAVSTSGNIKLKSNSKSFFAYLANSNQIKDTAGVTKRVIGKVDFRVTSVNFIMKTYIDVNKPSNTISFDAPDYTNIEGGKGIFAARSTTSINSKSFNEKTTEYISTGAHTGDYKFCSDNIAWSANAFYCP